MQSGDLCVVVLIRSSSEKYISNLFDYQCKHLLGEVAKRMLKTRSRLMFDFRGKRSRILLLGRISVRLCWLIKNYKLVLVILFPFPFLQLSYRAEIPTLFQISYCFLSVVCALCLMLNICDLNLFCQVNSSNFRPFNSQRMRNLEHDFMKI